METKHINDRLEPLAVEAKSLSLWPAGKVDAPRQTESHRLRVVEDPDVADKRALGEVTLGVAAVSADKLPAADRPVRSEFALNPLSRRVIPYWRRRR